MSCSLLVAIFFFAVAWRGASGATWQARERLGWQAEEAGAAPSALEQWQQAAWPPQPSWWSQLWPWCADPQVTVRVTPLQPGGRAASAAELTLPASQLAREGLRPEAPPPLPAGQHLRPGDRPGGREEEGGGGNGYYSYNSSDMAPLLPLWLSWMADASHMSNRSRGLDFDVARTLSRYVAVAYCNISNIQPWNCSRCGGDASGFTTERVVFDPAWDLLGYVGYSQPLGAIVVAFRGTDSHSIYNWVENMRTWRTDYALTVGYPNAPQNAFVHGGFFYSFNASALAPNITDAVLALRARHPDAPVYVTGHSLGGALATVCAMHVKLLLGVPDVRVFTFGSPRVGNSIFATWFEKEIKVHYRFTHDRDIVPSVPPTYMGFYHVSREVWLVDLLGGHPLVGICDASGEDAMCHSAVCHLGLCSSISDHLLYLSEMYSPHPEGC